LLPPNAHSAAAARESAEQFASAEARRPDGGEGAPLPSSNGGRHTVGVFLPLCIIGTVWTRVIDRWSGQWVGGSKSSSLSRSFLVNRGKANHCAGNGDVSFVSHLSESWSVGHRIPRQSRADTSMKADFPRGDGGCCCLDTFESKEQNGLTKGGLWKRSFVSSCWRTIRTMRS
jgi:hypothetical protein